MSKYLTVTELAERWKISPSAIYMCKGGTGALTRIRIGKLVRFFLSEVEALEAEKVRKAKKAA